ncbi:aryl-sulfate sulfotransferase [Winogradskyella sp.]|uniref:aryl-sulfate sulfotransferase n=1 Tax=Winogradskyella sp. TaxID=1883156 RepID=UPI003BABC830
MLRPLFILLFLISLNNLKAQATFGTQLITNQAFEGYTLFSVHKKAYLIDNCGNVINEWESNYLPGNSVYLLPNGNILRAGRFETIDSPIQFGGRGGIVEMFNWEGDVIWSYTYIGEEYRQHHDAYPMPNGNVLILAATVITNNDAIEAGRDPLKLGESTLFNEQIIEVEPFGTNSGNIVWEWNVIDHVIQDYDASKNNFGDISDNPGKLDINFLNGLDSGSNWLHINSIQYNEESDQIVISSRRMCEFWIIDHSTTTAEAASSNGGSYGMGGDFLYRWGNPMTYRQGNIDDRKLFGQHFPYIIPSGLPNENKIIVFNNGIGRTPLYSQVDILKPLRTANGSYEYTQNTAYGPTDTYFSYPETAPVDDSSFFSGALSSAQQLSNGNILICEGTKGRFFEINSTNDIVWEYKIPVSHTTGLPFPDNSAETVSSTTFRALKYSIDYEAFQGRDLTPSSPLEINPDIDFCVEALSANDFNNSTDISIYPNPTSHTLNIESLFDIGKAEIYSPSGAKTLETTSKAINLEFLNNGIYFLKLYFDDKVIIKKIIKV